MLSGQKRERFEIDNKQLPLPFEPTPEQAKEQEEQLVENINYIRRKQTAHKGRLALPEHLQVEEKSLSRSSPRRDGLHW